MQITNEEAARHYKSLIPYQCAIAQCWFPEDYQAFAFAVSEPCRLILKLTQGYEATRGWRLFADWPLDVRRLRLNEQAFQSPQHRRMQAYVKAADSYIIRLGKRRCTIRYLETEILRYFEEEYEVLKEEAGRELALLDIDAKFSEQILEFFWESIIGEKALPLTPTIRKILCWDSKNRMTVIDRLLWLIDNPKEDEHKYDELRRLAKSMILSYLREYYGTTKEWEELVSDFTELNIDGLEDADFAELEARQELEFMLSLITNPKDRKVVELAIEYEEKGLSTEEIESELRSRFTELGLGFRGFYQRRERMREKYPELNKRLQPFRKK